MAFWQDIIDFFTNPLLLISVVFWIIAFSIVKIFGKKGKDTVAIFFPFVALFKTQKLNLLFRRVAKKNPRFWRIFWNIGIIASFIFMMYGVYFFTANFISLILNPKPENAIYPLIPGVTIGLPIFSYLILPILLVITVHEFSHAIAAEADNLEVKSSGLFGAGIFAIIGFGAFVEIDDYKMYSKRYSPQTRLRIAAAGVWSNILFAALIFVLLVNFPAMMRFGYQAEVFKINTVLPASQGGFNQGNLKSGDIVISINDTMVDANNNADLSDILDNKTNLKCSIGDHLLFTCYDPNTKSKYEREAILGFRSFVGFEIEKYNNSAFKIVKVYSARQGGNNEDIVSKGLIIKEINGTKINYTAGQTFEKFLTTKIPNYSLNLTSSDEKNYEIDVNFFPKVPGAHIFDDIFIGIDYKKKSSSSIEITYVFDNEREYGINEGRIPVGAKIISINNVPITINNRTFTDFLKQEINPSPGDILTFIDENGKEYRLKTTEIPVITVFLGIMQESYWLPSNWIGDLFGGSFPNYLGIELYFTWIISFSIALFNLLPISIFDGGRMIKEIINSSIGEKRINPQKKKKLRYQFDPNEPKQPLLTQRVKRILSAKVMDEQDYGLDDQIPSNNRDDLVKSNIKSLEFNALDTFNSGYIDTIEIKQQENLSSDSIIEIEIEYEEDLQEPLKKKIYYGISLILGIMIIASFIISIVKFGTTFFWL